MTDKKNIDCGSITEALTLLRENHPLTGGQKDRVIEILQVMESGSVADAKPLDEIEAIADHLLADAAYTRRHGGQRVSIPLDEAQALGEAVARGTECRSVSLDTLREHLDHYTFAADHSIGTSAERNSAVEEFLETIIAEHTDCGSVDGGGQ